MKRIIIFVLVISFVESQFQGIYLNTGGCPNYTPATNIDVDRCSTVWSVIARSRISNVETRLDCSRLTLILNNYEKSEIAIYVRPRGTTVIHGHHAFLGFAASSNIGYYNVLNVIGMTSSYIRGSVWILDTDNETYCILAMCNSQLSIGNTHVYVLGRGTPPDNLKQIASATLLENKLNPEGLIWGLNRNC